MRLSSCVIALVFAAALGLASAAAAQPVAPPTIQRVTLQPETGVITISGSGLGPELVVVVDGQPATVLPDASSTQLEVQAPATVLATPGTYRLTVVDLVRQIGDAFVVASQPASVGLGHPAVTETASAMSGAAPVRSGLRAAGADSTAVLSSAGGASPMTVIEDSGSPYRTAIGYQALFNNTVGVSNTASGYLALQSNTAGNSNTASGYLALRSNTTGNGNTASGMRSLVSNTAGSDNTASGYQTLHSNTTGQDNTASGYLALASNTTASSNTASGSVALYSNTTGAFNTANGYAALFSNSTASANAASGFEALYSNTTGFYNTAGGYRALYSNTIGYANAAHGTRALYSNTTGYLHTANGFDALYSNTTGIHNTANGYQALYANRTGSANVAVGLGAGFYATGSYNVFLGADVNGETADANTIRIGLPYDSAGAGTGQNRTFIAGIRGTQLDASAVPVFIDANGQLGTQLPPVSTGGVTMLSQLQQQELVQQLQDQQRTNAELRARLARLEALVAKAAKRQQP